MLDLYKASAGAGKTHRLSGDYLKMLFSEEYAYRHILAVTFTNKATEEMKGRILSELACLADPAGDSPFMEDILALDRIRLMSDMDLLRYGSKEAYVRALARKNLIALLNDYSSFNISTIDRFFQLVMRSFAREIGKYSSYRVELDENMVLDSAIDSLYDSLDKPESAEILEWMLEMSLDSIQKGESWDVRRRLSSFASKIFSEEYMMKRKQVAPVEKDTVRQIMSEMKDFVSRFEASLSSLASEFINVIESSGESLSLSDFKGGSRSPFMKIALLSSGKSYEIPESLISAAYASDDRTLEGWAARRTRNNAATVDAIGRLYHTLHPILCDMVSLYSKDSRKYRSYKKVLSDIYFLGLVNDISGFVDKYTAENNLVLISQTTDILNSIIGEDDAPFIYEKTGTRIDHYMLDEFQDTSVMQWANFRPLISDSLAAGSTNLVVGDIKQSIYRWRGSDWRILGGMIESDLGENRIRHSHLKENWRSMPVLIDFNNRFFEYAGKSASDLFRCSVPEKYSGSADRIEKIYSDFAQNVPASRYGKDGLLENYGYVEVNPVPEGEESVSWKDEVLDNITQRVADLLQAGYGQSDIAFLVRTRKEGEIVVDRLLSCGYNVISDDSLLVSSSSLIRGIVAGLKNMLYPENGMNLLYDGFPVPDPSLSLYEMCGKMVASALAVLDEDSLLPVSPFVNAFMDAVLQYVTLEGSDVYGFVQWWDAYGVKMKLPASEDQDAIRVMTIHKSKGLGFGICIMPFLDDRLDPVSMNDSWIWAVPEDEILSRAGVIPVKYSGALADTLFDGVYYEEKLLRYVDCLNMSYVAFTRAKNGIIVYMPEPERKRDGSYPSGRISDILYSYLSVGSFEYDENLHRYSKGVLPPCKPKNEDNRDMTVDLPYVSSPIGGRLRLSLKNTSFAESGVAVPDNKAKGILYHALLQRVVFADDVRSVAETACSDGLLQRAEVGHAVSKLSEMIDFAKSRKWFDNDGKKVLNEMDILLPDGSSKRPDRVMFNVDGSIEVVDYKFGDNISDSYVRQLRSYADILESMGFHNVMGYIWYVERKEIYPVTV